MSNSDERMITVVAVGKDVLVRNPNGFDQYHLEEGKPRTLPAVKAYACLQADPAVQEVREDSKAGAGKTKAAPEIAPQPPISNDFVEPGTELFTSPEGSVVGEVVAVVDDVPVVAPAGAPTEGTTEVIVPAGKNAPKAGK